jgi:uncharacterized protein YciI
MIVVHVGITCSEDYVARREPHRRAHIERLAALRAAGTLVAGGPDPAGHRVDLFYHVGSPDRVGPLIEEDPYRRSGAWTGYAMRVFGEFVEPWEAPPIVLDGSRRTMVVEGSTSDPELARFALIELRGQRRLALGGLFPAGDTLAVVPTDDPSTATAWLAETGFWTADRLSARPWLYVI